MTAPEPAPAGTRPLLAAIRVGLVDAPRRLARPWLVTAAAVVVLVIAAFRVFFGLPTGYQDDPPTDMAGPGVIGFSILLFVLVPAGYPRALTSTMPFAQHLGVTRRHFCAATALIVLAETLVHAVVLTALILVEQATTGWGAHLPLFSLNFLAQPAPLVQVAVLWVPLLAFCSVALAVAALRLRFGRVAVWALGGLAAGAVVVGVPQGLLPAVRDVAVTPSLGTAALAPLLVLAAVVGAAGFLLVRRAPVR